MLYGWGAAHSTCVCVVVVVVILRLCRDMSDLIEHGQGKKMLNSIVFALLSRIGRAPLSALCLCGTITSNSAAFEMRKSEDEDEDEIIDIAKMRHTHTLCVVSLPRRAAVYN